ncbi:MAG: ABC transporter permease [Bacteroidia bacterium]|nr:ABC transporter permease [Bacteroidia bacterium]
MIFLTLLRESVVFALNALRVNRLRTLLSLLGITIGIFAIIAVFTAVDSMERKVRASLESLGENVIFVQKWPWTFGPDYPWWKYMNRPLPRIRETKEIEERSESVDAAVFNGYIRKTIFYNSSFVENAQILSTTKGYEKVKDFDVQFGRFFIDEEVETGKPVCIIGSGIGAALFNGEDPTGRELRLYGQRVTIIGQFAREGESMFGNSLDNMVVLPADFTQKYVDLETDQVTPMIMVKGKNGITAEKLTDELEGLMRSVRRLKPGADDNFSLNEVSLLTSQTESIFRVFGTAGWIIGAFSILVGGFGIANIMFVSVKERTNQIGIQKALGARNWFILVQFLVESVVLCIIGGIIGLIMVYIGTTIASSMLDFEFVLTSSNIILGLTISAMIGIISGFIPSYSASQLDPVEAIRSGI